MVFTDTISRRAVGAFPLSIATSLAIESALGQHPDIVVRKIPILNFDELWINVKTLCRNLIGALEKDSSPSVDQIAQALSTEMEMIQSIVSEKAPRQFKIVFYLSNYRGIETKYPYAMIRRDNTVLQKEHTEIINRSIGLLLKYQPTLIQGFDLKIFPTHRHKVMIITHIAYDLINYEKFEHLSLLESHTGIIKERAQWHTKYVNGKELSMIPFREDFLQIFGDMTWFKPGDMGLRKELIEVALKYRWTALTTRDKFLYGINQLKNPYSREVMKTILV